MKTTPTLVSLMAILALISIACQGEQRATSPERSPTSNQTPQTIATAKVTRVLGALAQAPARIRSRQQAMISSRISAIVLSMPFREGDIVRAGETLVRLDDAPQRAALTAAEAQLSTAESESRRITSLLAKGAATVREADEVKARLEGARAALAEARDIVGSTSLRAPFAGRIVKKSVNPGDLAQPGAPLLELQGGSALELVATLEPDAARSVRLGQKFRVRVDGVDPSVEATVYSISPTADETTHRVDVLFNLGAEVSLKPGLFARIELPAAEGASPGPLSIPASSVIERGGLTGVFVVKDGRAFLRWIALGREIGERVEVRAGLAEGESVVISPAGLTDGATLTSVEEKK